MGKCLLLIGFLINVVLGALAQSLVSNFYFNKGVDLYGQGKYEKAIPYFEKSDELDKAELLEGDMRREYSTVWLASCYYKLGNLEKAEKLSPFYKLPPVDRRVTVESDCYGALAQQKLFEGDYDAALEYVLKGAELEKQYLGENSLWYGNSLSMVSLCYSYLDDNQKAEVVLLESLRIIGLNLGTESELYIRSQLELATMFQRDQTPEKITQAITILNDIYPVSKRNGWDCSDDIADLLSLCYFYKRDYFNVSTWLGYTIADSKELNGQVSEQHQYFVYNAMDLYKMFGKEDSAIRLGKEFVGDCENVGMKDSIAGTIALKVCQIYEQIHQPHDALEWARKASQFFVQYGKDNEGYICSLSEMSTCYTHMGEHSEALKCIDICLKHYEDSHQCKNISYIACLNNASIIYNTLGNYGTAAKLALKSIEYSEKVYGKDHLQYFMNLMRGMEVITMYYGNRPDKLEIFYSLLVEQASRMQKRLMDWAKVSLEVSPVEYGFAVYNFYHNLVTYSNQDIDWSIPLAEVDRLMEYLLALLGSKHPLVLNFMDLRALIYSKSGKFNLAANIKHSVNALSEEIYGEVSAGSLGQEGIYMLKSGHVAEGVSLCKLAFDGYRKEILKNFKWLTAEERANYWNRYCMNVQEYVPIAFYVDEKEVMPALAYNSLLLSKGLLLNSEIELQKILQEKGDNEQLVALLEKWRSLRQKLDRMISDKGDFSLEAYKRTKEDADKVERQLLTSSQEFGDYTKALALTYNDVRSCLGPNDRAIEFGMFYTSHDNAQYCALVLDAGTPQPRLIALATEKEYQEAMSEAYTKPDFYNLLWKKLEGFLTIEGKIYFSPAGIFHKVGIEYLPGTSNYQLYRLSSTRELAISYTLSKEDKAVVYGGLEYNMGADDRQQLLDKFYGNQQQEVVFRDSPSLSDLKQQRAGLAYLQGSEEETRAIGSLLEKNHIPMHWYTGMDGTEESFKYLSGKKVTLLHIATHGFYEKKDMSREIYNVGQGFSYAVSSEDYFLSNSGLFLTGAGDYLMNPDSFDKKMEDGILTSKELSRLDLRGLDLVVLSACQTALGDITSEGVFGLQRGLKKSGAHTIVMSLWKVNDKATQILMTEFYKNLFTMGDKQKALKEAQLYLKAYKNGIYSSPSCWAAFVILDGIEH